MGLINARHHVTAGVVGILGIIGALAGNGTEGRVPRAAPAGLEIEVDAWGGNWRDARLVRWLPDGRVEVWIERTPAPAQTLARQRVRYRFGAMWSSIALWSPAHFLLMAQAVAALLLLLAHAFRVSDLSDLRERLFGRSSSAWKDALESVAERPREGVQAGVIQLAFDHARRAKIQSELSTLADELKADRPGRQFARVMEALAAHATSLRGAASRWEEFQHPHVETEERVRRAFEHFTHVERGRYVVETVRGDARGVRRVEMKTTSRAEEGGGFVVVSIVLAWKGYTELFANPEASGRFVAIAEDAFNPLRVNVRAFEVIWVPATPTDVMSSAELVAVFPEIRWIDAASRHTLGRIHCGSCATAYAGELGECPYCGAPREPQR